MKKRTGLALLLGACITMAAASESAAATIVNENTDASLTLDFFELGQSFTALDSDLLSIGFWMRTANPSTADNAFSIRLYEGEGTGGALLATRSAVAPLDLATTLNEGMFLDLGFAGTSLTIGGLYTAVISADANRLGIGFDRGGSYDGGAATITGMTGLLGSQYAHCFTGGCDTAFRVIGETATAVPEPGTWALMIAGFGLAGAALRQRRTQRA